MDRNGQEQNATGLVQAGSLHLRLANSEDFNKCLRE